MMLICMLYNCLVFSYNSLGSFGLTLVWCRCVSQVLVVPTLISLRGEVSVGDGILGDRTLDHLTGFRATTFL